MLEIEISDRETILREIEAESYHQYLPIIANVVDNLSFYRFLVTLCQSHNFTDRFTNNVQFHQIPTHQEQGWHGVTIKLF